jgi:hypothetical protein
MRWIRIIIVSLSLLTPGEFVLAQGLDALAYETVEPSRIKLGESAIIRVISFGRIKDVTIPTIPGLVFEAMGRSEGFDFVNGSTIPATFYLIRVTPQFAGVFSIPGLTPNARSIGLEVVKGDEPNPYTWHSQQPATPPIVTASLPKGVQLQAGGAAFVHLAIPARPVYVGESVPVEVEVGLRAGIVTSVNGLPTLKGSDFTFNNLSARRVDRRRRFYTAHLAQRSLSGQTGRLRIVGGGTTYRQSEYAIRGGQGSRVQAGFSAVAKHVQRCRSKRRDN